MQEVITTADSRKKTERILGHLASNGEYVASGIRDGFVLYTRDKDGTHEQLYVESTGPKSFKIVKTTQTGL